MTQENSAYTAEQIAETKRLLHTLYDGCVVQNRSVEDAVVTLLAESNDGPYKECYGTALKRLKEGESLFGLFESEAACRDLFLHSVTHELVEGEKDGSLFDRLLPIYKAVQEAG